MFLLPLRELAGSGDPQSNSQLVGPEFVGSTAPAIDCFDPLENELVLCRDLSIQVLRGPCDWNLRLPAPTWVFLTGLRGQARLRGPSPLARESDLIVDSETFVFLAPGANARLTADVGSAVEIVAAPPPGGSSPLLTEIAAAPFGGIAWAVSRGDLEPALGPRDKVKIVEPNLWRPQAKPGFWQAGSEIRSASLAFGVFRKGAPESTHAHQRSWEMYQVLEGVLELSLRRYRLGPWEGARVQSGQALLLPPGTGHIVHRDSDHVTAVIQSPPAISDRETVSYSPSNPSLELPFDD